MKNINNKLSAIRYLSYSYFSYKNFLKVELSTNIRLSFLNIQNTYWNIKFICEHE